MQEQEHHGKKTSKDPTKTSDPKLVLECARLPTTSYSTPSIQTTEMLLQCHEKREKGEPKEQRLTGVTHKEQTSCGMVCPGLTMFTTGPSVAASSSRALTEISNVGNLSVGASRVFSTSRNVSSPVVGRKSLYQDLSPSPEHGKQR